MMHHSKNKVISGLNLLLRIPSLSHHVPFRCFQLNQALLIQSSHLNKTSLYDSSRPHICSGNLGGNITICPTIHALRDIMTTSSTEDRAYFESLNSEHLGQRLQIENKQLDQLLQDYKDHLFKDLARREELSDGSNPDYEDGIKEYEEWTINSKKDVINHIKEELAKKGVVTATDPHIRELEEDIHRLRACLGMRDGERQRWILAINKHAEKEKDLRIAFWCSTFLLIFTLLLSYYMYPDVKNNK